MERFTWNEEEHRPHFFKLAENIAMQKEKEGKNKNYGNIGEINRYVDGEITHTLKIEPFNE